MEDGFASRLQNGDLWEASGLVREKEQVTDEVGKRPAVIYEALKYATYLYLEHFNSVSNNDAQYKALKEREKMVRCNLKGPKTERYLNCFLIPS